MASRLKEIVPVSCWSLLDTESLIGGAVSKAARDELRETQPQLPNYVLKRRVDSGPMNIHQARHLRRAFCIRVGVLIMLLLCLGEGEILVRVLYR